MLCITARSTRHAVAVVRYHEQIRGQRATVWTGRAAYEEYTSRRVSSITFECASTAYEYRRK